MILLILVCCSVFLEAGTTVLCERLYEPHKNMENGAGENYFIDYPSKEIFTLGIVYSKFTHQDAGVSYPTFSILTTPANHLLKKNTHNADTPRML